MSLLNLSPPFIVNQQQNNLANYVGKTPLLLLQNISKKINPNVRIFAKAEWHNPSGSIKDRPALSIIQDALKKGLLNINVRLLDSTSGNMGIAYATLCASMGISVTITIPSNASKERFSILHALGAELILTDPLEGSDGAMVKARELVDKFPNKYFYANQYDNPENWKAHYRTTGPEIWEQTQGTVSHFVTGLGTSGTHTGTTSYLKEMNPEIESIAFQPDSAFHGLEGLKHMGSSQQPGIYNKNLADVNLEISTERTYNMLHEIAKEEGLIVGISSAAAILATLQVAEKLDHGTLVTILPDSGYKYLSNPIWDK